MHREGSWLSGGPSRTQVKVRITHLASQRSENSIVCINSHVPWS